MCLPWEAAARRAAAEAADTVDGGEGGRADASSLPAGAGHVAVGRVFIGPIRPPAEPLPVPWTG